MSNKNYLTTLKVLGSICFLLQQIQILNAVTPASLESRIINGKEVQWEGTRYQVSLRLEKIDRYYFGVGHLCGGSIIARNIILTAAHCIWNEDSKEFRSAGEFSIVMGNLDRTLNNNHTLKLGVAKIITGPQYNYTTFQDDLAVLFLNQSIPEDFTRAEVIEINENLNIKDGTTCTVTGWGLTEKGVLTKNLMSVEVPIVNKATCSLNYEPETILDDMLCAGYMKGERDACSGDSGGPLVCDDKLVGIVSFGWGCALPGYPGVYSNVAYYNDWLRNLAGLIKKDSEFTTNFTLANNTNFNYTFTNSTATISFSRFIIVVLTLFNIYKYKISL